MEEVAVVDMMAPNHYLDILYITCNSNINISLVEYLANDIN